ncbi:hypothetical protein Tco_0850534 [Tanacetum coccineum]
MDDWKFKGLFGVLLVVNVEEQRWVLCLGTARLSNDILMFQQHQGESLSEAWTRFKDLLKKSPHHGIDLWFQVQIFYDHVNPAIRRTIDQSAGGKLHDRNTKESWPLLEDLALYDNESWNGPKDFAKSVKAISLPQDVPSTSDRCLIELENQVQRLMEAHLAPKQYVQVNKITSSCEICSGLHDTQYCMENPEQAFVEYASSRNNKVGANEEVEEESKEELEEETKEETEEEEDDDSEYFDTFPTVDELRYHEWILKNPRPPWVNAKIKTRNMENIKIKCMVGQFPKKQAYTDLESPINVMSKLNYYWIMSEGLKPRKKPSNPEKIRNFVGRVKGLKVFVRNFTYECDFVVLEDTTSVIDHYLGGMVLGRPFVKETRLVYDKDEGTVMLKKVGEKIIIKMPHKMEMFEHIDKDILKTDNIPSFIMTGDDGNQKNTYY